MTITIEELRKVYQDARQAFIKEKRFCYEDQATEAGWLAVARFVAERQRAVEPTDEMESAFFSMNATTDREFGDARYRWTGDTGNFFASYRAMSAVAPLVVPE